MTRSHLQIKSITRIYDKEMSRFETKLGTPKEAPTVQGDESCYCTWEQINAKFVYHNNTERKRQETAHYGMYGHTHTQRK